MSHYETFTRLHQASTPLLLGNCWDVQSAKTLEAAGYSAIGFSSHALSAALGYEDGENLPFDLLLQMTQRVVASIKIPFTVDLEGGFSRNLAGLLKNIDLIQETGAAGINLEDTIAEDGRHIQSAKEFARTIGAIANHLEKNNRKLFLNIRTDGFLLDLPTALSETLTRIRAYGSAGATGIFVPCIADADDIQQVVQATALPINVMAVPGLPAPAMLQQLGVKRISMGPFLFGKVYEHAAALAKSVLTKMTLAPII